ncbi:MAG: radical SAM protein [Candidatus Nanoarchaeia archaeon]|nr:radical SAM protein [Candidatus Nanoarchaeia archaeon]
MIFKSVNLLCNNYCNNKCNMCHIWKNTNKIDLSIEDIISLFSHEEFREVEDISLSGGEALMRRDLVDVIDKIIEHNPNLKNIFLNTNGTYPERAKNICEKYIKNPLEIYVCVSIEGPKDLNNKLRGVETYGLALKTLELVKSVGASNIKTIISTTFQFENGTIENLEYLSGLAKDLGSTLTFRFAGVSETYYQNLKNPPKQTPKVNQLKMLELATKKFPNNQFLQIQKEFTETGKIPIMQNSEREIVCKAGEAFCFVKADGNIYPCLYSSRIIGTVKTGVKKQITNLGAYEPCPCCTECHVYPMLNYVKNGIRI